MFRITLVLITAAAAVASPRETMPVAQQNALVMKYCAVCHTDASRNGGLTLQHYDAANSAPSLSAMLLSKITGGGSVEATLAAASDPVEAAAMAKRMKGGAMGAAELPVPDAETTNALAYALAKAATYATDWSAIRTTSSTVLEVSALREVTAGQGAGEAAMYRLVLSCNTMTRVGEVQLAWSPAPKRGTLFVAVDGLPPIQYKVEGDERMGNGAKAITGPAATHLRGLEMPTRSLTVSNLFPDQSAVFTFDNMDHAVRTELSACFK